VHFASCLPARGRRPRVPSPSHRSVRPPPVRHAPGETGDTAEKVALFFLFATPEGFISSGRSPKAHGHPTKKSPDAVTDCPIALPTKLTPTLVRGIGKTKPLFRPAAATACLWPASAGSRRGAGGVPSTPQRPAARRAAALRRLDMPLRMGDGSASRVSAARASGRPGWEGRGGGLHG
jgi:hypothetical protein